MDYYEIIKKLIGKIEPIGESNTDEIRYHNLEETIKLVDMLISDISRASASADRSEYSMQHIGKRANEWLHDLYNALGDDA